MDTPHLEVLQKFDETSLPDLDVVVLGALELFGTLSVPSVDITQFTRPLVLGSGNAAVTGRLLFAGEQAMFTDESRYRNLLENGRGAFEDVIIISASGAKHAIGLAHEFRKAGAPVWLFTNNPEAPAAAFLDADRVKVFPRNREPYTYNTSTYLGMLLGKSGEDPIELHSFIRTVVAPLLGDDLFHYDAFYFIIPPELYGVRDMLLTKFDELFGPQISGRVFTFEQSKHAKTVVPGEKELFISFGEPNEVFGAPARRLHIPLPANTGPAALMAIGYYLIGHIQKQHPPYFKDNIREYVQTAATLFGHDLSIIVE